MPTRARPLTLRPASVSAEEGHKLLLLLHACVREHVERAGVGYVAEAEGESIAVYYGFPALVERGEEHACALALVLGRVRHANRARSLTCDSWHETADSRSTRPPLCRVLCMKPIAVT